jgi:hypothetical protein
LGHRDVTEQIDLEQAAPFGHRHGFERCIHLDTCVVDQRAQGPAQRVASDAVGDGNHIRINGDVEDDRLDPVGPQGLGVDVTADTGQHVKAPSSEFSCSGCAHASRGTGHDDQLLPVGIRGIHAHLQFELTTSSEIYQLS